LNSQLFAEFRLRIGQKKFSINFPLLRHYNCFRRGKKTQISVEGILSREMIKRKPLPQQSDEIATDYLPGGNDVMDLGSPAFDRAPYLAKDLKMSVANTH
jgi:hypothetical protein